ncbi:hypothetical protein [Roseibium polysiphoniae]|uniref:hypothetical protein n=1 Tax=Roseibium polysiphoniae TaxID=2571221 RepID=UPI003299FDB3
MRLTVYVFFSFLLSCYAGVSVAQTPSLSELQGVVEQSRAQLDQARERRARTEARQIIARVELRSIITQDADTHVAETAIRELEKKQPDFTELKARFLADEDRHNIKLAQLKSDLGDLQQTSVDTSEIDLQIAGLRDDLRDFDDYRARALQELRDGYFCSQCSRPASQIVKETGKSFKQHLRDVSGRPIPMSESRVAKKRAEFDRQRRNIAAKLKSLEDKRTRLIQERADKVAKLQQAINKEYDSFTEKRTAFDADVAATKKQHEIETETKVHALKAKVKEAWETHRDAIDAKQKELLALDDELSQINDQIHQHELEEMKAGFAVDRALTMQRWEMERKARELARERTRLRQKAQASFLNELYSRQQKQARAAQLRRQRASPRFRQAMERTRSERFSPHKEPLEWQPPDKLAHVAVEVGDRDRKNEPVLKESSPSLSQRAYAERQTQEPPQASEPSKARKILQRFAHEEQELERAEQEQHEKALEIARLELARASSYRAEVATLSGQGLDADASGNYFSNEAGWVENIRHPADVFVTESNTSLPPDRAEISNISKTIVASLLSGRSKDNAGGPVQGEASPWNKVYDQVSKEFDETKGYYRKKLAESGEVLVLGFIKSRASELPSRVTDSLNSLKESLNLPRYIVTKAADVAHDGVLRINYESRTGQRFDDLSEFEQNAERVLAAGRRITLPREYLQRLVNRYEVMMNSTEKSFLSWQNDDY